MNGFPYDEIDRIIREEIVRGHGTNLWTKPQARRRYQKFLMTLIIGERGSDDGRRAHLLDCIFDGHYELAPYCSDTQRLFAFAPDATHRLVALLTLIRDIIGRTLDDVLRWPADAIMPHDQGRAFLLLQHEQLEAEIARVQLLGGTHGGTIALHSQRAVLLDQALQTCRYLLLTAQESGRFDEYYSRAQKMLRQSGPLFNLPDSTSVN